MSTFVFTTGGDFDFSGQVTVVENDVLVSDMTGWTGTCGVRSLQTGMVTALAFTWLDAQARLCRVYLAAGSLSWAPGVHEINLNFTGPEGQKLASPITQFMVARGPAGA